MGRTPRWGQKAFRITFLRILVPIGSEGTCFWGFCYSHEVHPFPYCCHSRGSLVFSILLRGFRPILSSFSVDSITCRLCGSHGGGAPRCGQKAFRLPFSRIPVPMGVRGRVFEVLVTPMRCFRPDVVIFKVCMCFPPSWGASAPYCRHFLYMWLLLGCWGLTGRTPRWGQKAFRITCLRIPAPMGGWGDVFLRFLLLPWGPSVPILLSF